MIAPVVGGARRLVLRTHRAEVGARARLLFASDLHLGLPWTRGVPRLLADAVSSTAPDAVLLGGDLVERAAGLPDLAGVVAWIAERVPVGAVPGNHDSVAGRARVREVVTSSGGTWLPDEPLAVGRVVVHGRITSGAPAHVLCAHDPAVWPRARETGYALTLAGHLHGCQVRFASRDGREYPGAWFYRWNGPRFDDGGRTLLVSRGMADTLPFRWNCPHDALLAECV